MKKIIVAAVAIACGAFAQAATVDWRTGAFSKIYEAGTTALLPAGTAYLFDAATYGQAAVLAAFAANTDLGTMDLTGTKAVASGVISTGTFTTTLTGVQSLYVAVISDGDLYLSSTVAADILAVGTTVFTFNEKTTSQAAFVGTVDGAYAGAGWYQASAVPEPTSGLLLLLGMAGLALKRKRA